MFIIFAYYFQIISLTNYVSDKIEGHVPPQRTAAKNRGHVSPKATRSAYNYAPRPQISKANFAYAVSLNSRPRGQ